MSLGSLVEVVSAVRERLDVVPSFRWGTFEAGGEFVFDGDASVFSPSFVFGDSSVGVRGLGVLAGRRVFVWSVRPIPPPPPPPPEPNVLLIDGVKYPASGSVAVQVGSFPYWDGKVAATTLQIPFPCDLPQGWTFEMFALHSWSFTVVQTGEVDRSTRRIKARTVQFYANSVNALSRVGWRLVKE